MIDATPFMSIPRFLNDAHFQHHLFALADRHHGDDFVFITYETPGDIGRIRRLDARLDRAAQDDIVVDRFRRDPARRHQARQKIGQRIEIALDLNFKIEDLVALRVEEKRIRLTDGETEKINAARRTNNCINDRRLRDKNV